MYYNNPFIKILETLANMLIVSFFWVLFSLPIVTVIASSAALFHTTSKIIFGPGRGKGVFRDFFDSFRQNLIPGIKLSLIVIVCIAFIAEGLWTGYQIWKLSIWGMLYMILGILIAFVFAITLIHVPPVLSRFDAPISSIIRMAIYFAIRKPLRSILLVLLLGLMVYSVETIPLALLIVPALYSDLVRAPLDRDMVSFAKDNGLETDEEDEQKEETVEEPEDSMMDLEEKFSGKGKKEK